MRQAARCSSFVSLCLVHFIPLFISPAQASGERQLLAAINDYRAQPQRCEGRRTLNATPLALKANLALPVGYAGRLREGLQATGYQAVKVRSIRLVGAQDAEQAFAMMRSDYCSALLDNQFADIGIRRARNDWQVVLARPVLDAQLGDERSASKALLMQVNAARAKPRLCGRQRFAAARPLTWSTALGTAAQRHSRAMANENFFAHRDPNGDLPADRAWDAGYRGRQIGENIAAGQGSPSKAMAGWLASPGHCANLMNPMFTQVGAAYVANARSDEGVYWTMVFGAP
ncbi:CAP domain-containing protein [Pseudomonas sp.]|uniref:CAP domain-containing protein n=1 Tax=Pseudomonas sp. TaxID=306 RepID=UPI0028AA3BF7|nr:CAP domain-containing protein [Pseudomonas sp.]